MQSKMLHLGLVVFVPHLLGCFDLDLVGSNIGDLRSLSHFVKVQIFADFVLTLRCRS